MSDPPKSNPFSFNTQATSGSTSNMFGQPSTNTSTTTGSLFGQSSGAPASANLSPFASNPTTSGTSPFGAFGSGATAGGSLFGGGGKPNSGGFNFGPNLAGNNPSGSFGTDKAGPTSNQASGSITSPLGFATLSTPNKSSDATVPSQTQTTNLFGGAKNTGESGLFGSANTNAGSSGLAETSTPTNKPGATFSFGTSTTPAGPPPTESIGTGGNSGSIFSVNKSQETKGSLFSPTNTTQSTASPASTFSGFGISSGNTGGIFGSKPAESGTPGSDPQTTSSLFNKSATDTAPSIFGKAGAISQLGTGTLGKPKDGESAGLAGTSSNTPSAETQSQTASKPSIFSTAGNPSLATGQGTQASNSSQTASITPSLFGSLGAKSEALGTTSPATGAGIFSDLNKPTPSNTSSTKEPTSITGTSGKAASSAPPQTSNLFGSITSSAAPSTTLQSTAPVATTNTSSDTRGTNATLGASTAGPPPPAQSRLKNKSMDEIITRWASDLSKYQKDFQRQAERVASWDRMLVENSDKIQKLYGSTLEAERATTEVERQLTAVENDQAELALWLEHYEKEVNQLMSTHVSQGDSQTLDQERERTYKLTDKLWDRLEEMGKDLTAMITEINDASSKLSKNSKADDPLSQVVRVLNSHLAQLQQIDQGAAALQAKVAAAQKAGQSVGSSNGFVGPSSDAADGFYKSYMGRS